MIDSISARTCQLIFEHDYIMLLSLHLDFIDFTFFYICSWFYQDYYFL